MRLTFEDVGKQYRRDFWGLRHLSLLEDNQAMQNVAVPALDDELARQVLQFLDCRSDTPTLRTLNRLIRAYIHKVPWESVFRIIQRHATRDTLECPRLPNEQ